MFLYSKLFGSSILTRRPAKPGFGKTVLCSRVIDQLGEFASGAQVADAGLSPCVVYYFFDKQSDFHGPEDAIRALLSQLFHLQRQNQSIVTTMKSKKDNSQVGQTWASNKEILDILCEVFLSATTENSTIIFVLDALDECSDPSAFLELLRKFEPISTCAFFISCRPTIVFPRALCHDGNTIRPDSAVNTPDIERFAFKEVGDLVDDGFLFCEDVPDEPRRRQVFVAELAAKISSRADSMFLWVKVLCDYLRSPPLTLRQRLDAITNLNQLEGMDALYMAIIRSLQTQFQGSTESTITRLFRLVSQAKRPLRIQELSVALTVPLERPWTPLDSIPSFERNLGPMSGALMETNLEGDVKFIHASTLEFFRRRTQGFCSTSSDAIVGACLAYLDLTVPPEPFGKPQQPPTEASTRVHQRYPFLAYCCRYWSLHLLDWFEEFGKAEQLPSAQEPIPVLLRSFVYNPRKITAWIEASSLFSFAPQVCLDITTFLSRSQSISTSLDWKAKILEDLNALREDLTNLNQDWGYILLKEPYEIWEPSIPAFSQSRFWVKPFESNVNPVGDSGQNSITIQSKLSTSGLEIGIIKLFPSR